MWDTIRIKCHQVHDVAMEIKVYRVYVIISSFVQFVGSNRYLNYYTKLRQCTVNLTHRRYGIPTWNAGTRRPDGAGRVRIPMRTTPFRNFGNSVYPALPVSFGGDTKSRRSLLSGVYARGSKRSHQSALECVTVVDSTTHSKLPTSRLRLCG